MSLPVPANTTCDIYRQGNSPPAAPDVAGVAIYLKPDFRAGMEAGEGEGNKMQWTHTAVCNTGVDVRDRYDAAPGFGGAGDDIFVPDQNGTRFLVMFVERRQRGTAQDHKLAYLRRWVPTWPTKEL